MGIFMESISREARSSHRARTRYEAMAAVLTME